MKGWKNKMSIEREKALDQAFSMIEKEFGKGSIMRYGSTPIPNVEVFPTGILPLDIALGVGGYPRGRIVEIFGPESSGKTTIALHAASAVQKMGGIVAFIDAEQALEPNYAQAIGVDVANLIISQPDDGEQALEIAEILVRSQSVEMVIVDTVAALVPKAELEGDFGDSFMGLQARLMSKSLRRLTASINKSKSCVLFLNQLREKISTGFQVGNPEVTPGGRALKFYASLRIDVRKSENIKQGENNIGTLVRAKVVKNKVAPPFKQAEFEITFGKGVQKTGTLLDLGVNYGLLNKSGTWYYWGETRLGQGRENAKLFLEENPDLMDKLEASIREIAFPNKNQKISEATEDNS